MLPQARRINTYLWKNHGLETCGVSLGEPSIQAKEAHMTDPGGAIAEDM